MREIQNLVINQIVSRELSEKQMGMTKGGKRRGRGVCTCGCCGYLTDLSPDLSISMIRLCKSGDVTFCPPPNLYDIESSDNCETIDDVYCVY